MLQIHELNQVNVSPITYTPVSFYICILVEEAT